MLLQRSQRDFESFNDLAERGALPTLREEVEAYVPNWARPDDGRLGAFASAADPAAQKRERMQRRQYETEGYVIVRQMFSAQEVGVLLQTLLAGPLLLLNH